MARVGLSATQSAQTAKGSASSFQEHRLRQALIFPCALPASSICSLTQACLHAAQDFSNSRYRSPPLQTVPHRLSLCSRNVSFAPTPRTCSLSERMATSKSSGSTQLIKPSSPAALSLMLSHRCAGTQGRAELSSELDEPCNIEHHERNKPPWNPLNISSCWACSSGLSLARE